MQRKLYAFCVLLPEDGKIVATYLIGAFGSVT
jgi:hypothetical protein